MSKTYSELRNNQNQNVSDFKIKILVILYQRKYAYKSDLSHSQGHGRYILLNKLNKNERNKITDGQLSEYINDLKNEKLIAYHDDNQCYFITEKGMQYLDFIKDKKGKALDSIMRKIY